MGVLERFWLRCLPPVERVLRRWTSVALKKATMKGCLFWGPCRPIRPANLGLMLCPRREGVKGTEERLQERRLVGRAAQTPVHPRLTIHPRAHHLSIASVASALTLRQVALGAWNTVGTTERKLPGPRVRPLVGKAARKHAGQGARGDTCVETNGAGEG